MYYLNISYALSNLMLFFFFFFSRELFISVFGCNYFDLAGSIINLLFIYFYEKGKKFDLVDLYVAICNRIT